MAKPFSTAASKAQKPAATSPLVKVTPESFLARSMAGAGAGLATVGAILDTTGGATRNILVGKSPLINPTTSDGRASGRDLLVAYGLSTPNDPEKWEVHDVLGGVAEIVADPLTYVAGIGLLNRTAKGIQAVAAGAKTATFAGQVAKGERALGSFVAKIPFTNKAVQLTPGFTGPRAMAVAQAYDKVSGVVGKSLPFRAAASLFDHTTRGEVSVAGQSLGRSITANVERANAPAVLFIRRQQRAIENLIPPDLRADDAVGPMSRASVNTALRSAVESVNIAESLLKSHVSGIIDANQAAGLLPIARRMQKANDTWKKMAERAGAAGKTMDVVGGMRHAPRYAIRKPTTGMPPVQNTTVKAKSATARKSALADIPARVLDRLGSDPEFAGTKIGQTISKAEREAIGHALSLSDYGPYIKPERKVVERVLLAMKKEVDSQAKKGPPSADTATIPLGDALKKPSEEFPNRIGVDEFTGAIGRLLRDVDMQTMIPENLVKSAQRAVNKSRVKQSQALGVYVARREVGPIFTADPLQDLATALTDRGLKTKKLIGIGDAIAADVSSVAAKQRGVPLATANAALPSPALVVPDDTVKLTSLLVTGPGSPGRLSVNRQKFFKRIAAKAGVSASSAKNMLISAEMANAVSNVMSPDRGPVFFKDGVAALGKYLTAFKRGVTTWPSFSVRNAAGAAMQTVFGGLVSTAADAKLYAKAMSIAHSIRSKGAGSEKWLDELKAYGVVESADDVMRLGTDALPTHPLKNVRDAAEDYVEKNPSWIDGVPYGKEIRTRYNMPIEVGQKANAWVEYYARAPIYIQQRLAGKSPAKAKAAVDATQFDYSKLTPFELNLKRAAIPFYGFTKNIIRSTAVNLYEKPRGFAAQSVLATNRMRDREPMPDDVAATTAIPLGRLPDGTKRYITQLGIPYEDALNFVSTGGKNPLNPIEAPAALLNFATNATFEALSSTAPWIRIPIEQVTGKSLFQRGRNTADMDPNVGRLLGNVRDIVTMAEKPGRPVQLPAGVELALSSTPLTRWLSAGRMLTDLRKGAGVKAAQVLTGVKVSDISPQRQQAAARVVAAQYAKELGAKVYDSVYFPGDIQSDPDVKANIDAYKSLMKALSPKRSKPRKPSGNVVSEVLAESAEP